LVGVEGLEPSTR